MLPRRKRRSISVEGRRFHYVVADSSSAWDVDVPLTILVQDARPNGAHLRVIGLRSTRLPENQSKYWMGLSLSRSVLPRHVAGLIRRAAAAGWDPTAAGPAFEMQVENPPSFDDLVDR